MGDMSFLSERQTASYFLPTQSALHSSSILKNEYPPWSGLDIVRIFSTIFNMRAYIRSTTRILELQYSFDQETHSDHRHPITPYSARYISPCDILPVQ